MNEQERRLCKIRTAASEDPRSSHQDASSSPTSISTMSSTLPALPAFPLPLKASCPTTRSSTSSSSPFLPFNMTSHFIILLLLLSLTSLAVLPVNALTQYFEQSPHKNLTIAKGSSITIPCKVRNRQGECLWIHDGKGIGIIRGKYEFRRAPDNGDCGLTIYDVTPDYDNGEWQCQVTAAAINQQTLQSEVIRLIVLISPRLLNISSTVSVPTGSPSRLYCNYEGDPKPTIRWYHINPRSGETSYVPNNGPEEAVLHILNTTYSHEGEYFCEATNQINTIDYVVRSSKIILDVYGLPAFLTKSPLPTEGRRGAQSEVSLWFCADPPPKNVYWRFGSLQLDALRNRKEGENVTIPPRFLVKPLTQLGSKRGLETASNCYDSTLLIKDTDIGDERDYVLVIENERGAQEGIVRLRVVTPLSATSLIAIALSILLLVVVISIVTLLMMLRKKKKGTDSIHDREEAKEDAQALSTSTGKNSSKSARGHPAVSDEKGGGSNGSGSLVTDRNGDRHELVYANLHFDKDNQPQPLNPSNAKKSSSSGEGGKKPPPTKPKPQITQRQTHPRNAANTEYAQIAFSNPTEL